MIISFEFPDHPIDLHIQLIDNPAVRSWADHFLVTPLTVTSHIVRNIVPHTVDIDKMSVLFEKCCNVINQLAQHGYVYNTPVPKSVHIVDRDWCNKAHRFFTHTQQTVNLTGMSEQQFKELTGLLQELNEAIHALEDFLPPAIERIPDFSFDEIYCSDEPTYNHPGWWKMPDEFRPYHSSEPATVILGSQILGKTLLRSYLDGDDPRDWDTSGHYCSNGALLIQPTDFRSKVYSSNDFYKWLTKYDLAPDQVTYDFPIGYAVNPAQLQAVYNKLKQDGHVKTTYKYE
jgi:hypothetical protein